MILAAILGSRNNSSQERLSTIWATKLYGRYCVVIFSAKPERANIEFSSAAASDQPFVEIQIVFINPDGLLGDYCNDLL
jgi:hypothetical protein